MELLAQIIQGWHVLQTKVKAILPTACTEAMESRAEQEMSAYKSNEQQEENFESEYDEATGEFVRKPPMTKGLSRAKTFDEFGGDKLTEWQAGWNVTNAIQGMFIVSLPYAVLHGGYWGVFALVFIAYIACYTGKILVECLYEPDETGELVRVRDSYVAVADAVIGEKYGGKMVNVAQIIELLMTCILYVVLCGDLLIGSFPGSSIDQRSWMVICAMFLLPCAFLKDLHAVSTLSFWCTACHMFINAVIFGYCFLQIGDWAWSKVTFRVNWSTFPITVGIVVFSYTSQIFLPSLEGNMVDKSKFHPMLNWSHIAAALFKGLFAYVGFLTFAEQTQEVITNNLPTRGFKALVNLTLVGKALLSYPLPYYAAAQLFEKAFFKKRPTEEFPHGEGPQPIATCWMLDGEFRVWAVALRVFLVLVTLLFAISIPHFAILMGLIGSFTGTMLSFVWPCYFHMKLKWEELSTYTKAWECFIIGFGFLCGVIGIYTSFVALVETYHLPVHVYIPVQ